MITVRTRASIAFLVTTGLTLSLGACSTTEGETPLNTMDGSWSDSSVRDEEKLKGTVFDPTAVHTISVVYDEADYEEMWAAYQESSSKEWIQATVSVDGETFENVGLRLKGNSSLRKLSADTEDQEVPWLIRLDKYVSGQNMDGYTEFVVRSNTTPTALNEAVAQTLFAQAGLAAQAPIAVRFSVNGSDEVLRLAVENPSDEWDSEQFGSDGLLYKAEADGDYSYRGDDPASYEDIFDQETNSDNLNYEPLINFLQFISESDDESFAQELPKRLDVEAFAAYLALQDLVNNFDDIDGPGNNSYLRWDQETGVFTVVSWDLNLAFGGSPGGNDGIRPGDGTTQQDGAPEGFNPEGFNPEGFNPEEFNPDDFAPDSVVPGNLPEGFGPDTPPEGFEPGQRPERPEGLSPKGEKGTERSQAGPGAMNRSNILKDRFLENDQFALLYSEAKASLAKDLIDSGSAQQTLDQWSTLLRSEASDLVSSSEIEQDASQIADHFTGSSQSPQAPESLESTKPTEQPSTT